MNLDAEAVLVLLGFYFSDYAPESMTLGERVGAAQGILQAYFGGEDVFTGPA